MNVDHAFMLKAIRLSENGRTTTAPNPWVGCVIVKNQEIIGQGFHQFPGGPHAEVVALEQAGQAAKDSTVYVTLEPCCHFGRTPPCVDALIRAQVARVVVGVQDLDRQVNGSGIARLQQAAIQVDLAATEAAENSLKPYLHHRKTGMPFCVGKAAISLDGRIAARDGSSKWLSNTKAFERAHGLRACSQAILVGSKTAVHDLPALTVRHGTLFPRNPPLRVVVDSCGELSAVGPLFDLALAPTLIATSELCPQARIEEWRNAGVEVEIFPLAGKNRIDLKELLKFLGGRGVLQLLIEGGGGMLGAFQSEKLLNRLMLFVAPKILGRSGKPLFDMEVSTMQEAGSAQLLSSEQLDECLCLEYSFS